MWKRSFVGYGNKSTGSFALVGAKSRQKAWHFLPYFYLHALPDILSLSVLHWSSSSHSESPFSLFASVVPNPFSQIIFHSRIDQHFDLLSSRDFRLTCLFHIMPCRSFSPKMERACTFSCSFSLFFFFPQCPCLTPEEIFTLKWHFCPFLSVLL